MVVPGFLFSRCGRRRLGLLPRFRACWLGGLPSMATSILLNMGVWGKPRYLEVLQVAGVLGSVPNYQEELR